MFTVTGYQVLEQITENSAVGVYRARREQDDRPVVLKRLRSPEPTQEELARLRREFEIIRQIAAPGVVEALELLNTPGCHALVLEDFGGQPLTRAVKAGRLPPADFLKLALTITRALEGVHQRHVIHKDINPANILLNPHSGVLKLIDFSISTRLASERQSLRAPQVLEGTLAYIAPEQTGRMNRAVDLRSDLYSLGATFYELLAGRPPFESQEPVALVHSQIAQQPLPLGQVVPGLSPALAGLVARLLAKNAEERYQSCAGLRADLESCLEQLQAGGRIGPLEPGALDRLEQFYLPQQLYGRAAETAALLAAFGRAAHPNGRAELVLIGGHPGVGKTSLVQELYQPLTLRGGYFVSGKFDQLRRNQPYFALLQALRALIQQILGEPAAQVAAWRALLLAALGANARVMLEVIPELELITGPQPPVAELPPGQAHNRYRLVFQNFARVFTRPEHPLVLFLDDLQWADAASLELLEFLAGAPGQQYLLIIATFRDNEVEAGHPLLRSVERIREAGGSLTRLALAPLALEDITHFIADAFHAPPAAARPLALLLEAKTGGNPFFINEFVKTLVAEQAIHFERGPGWVWNLDDLRSRPITDNVVDLLAGNIRRLSAPAQEVLRLAAHLGGQFDLQTLALAHQASLATTAADLWEAVQTNLVLPLSDSYKLAAFSEARNDGSLQVEYRFAHDRIRQAVIALTPPAGQLRLHHRLGRLLDALPPDQRAERIFEIANHLNLALELLGSAAEKQHLAEINLAAGQRARRSAAFQPAWNYFSSGLGLLPPAAWQENYPLALALHLEGIEAAYASGLFDPCLLLIETVLQQGRSLFDQSIAHQIIIKIRVAQNQPVAALEHALGVLSRLGVDLPLYPTEADLQRGMQQVQALLAGRPVDALADLPEMTDPNRLAAMQILTSTTVAAFNAIRPLYALISFERVRLSITYGNTPMSPAAYASYGLTLCGDPQQIDAGYQFGKMAMRLQDKLNAPAFRARTLITAYSFIIHWKEPVRSILAPMLDAYQSGLEAGDIEFASAALLTHAYSAFLSGLELPLLSELFQEHLRKFNRTAHPRNRLVLEMHLQVVTNLMQPDPTAEVISGAYYQEETAMRDHLLGSDSLTVFRAYVYKTLIACLFGRYAQAIEFLDLLEAYLPSARSELVSTLYYFYDSFVRLAGLGAGPASEPERVAANQAHLGLLAQHAPANHRHRFCLVEAERARLAGRGGEAREWYDEAIRLARENQFPQDEGLACERAAAFYLERGQARLATLYLHDAHAAFERWGARGKVEQLEARYPAYFVARGGGRSSPTTDGAAHVHALDAASLIKASLALSSEIVLEKVLAALMRIIIENAGAQTGFLLLEADGQWFVAAGEDGPLQAGRPVEAEPERLALSVVRYVIHTHETVALDDAARAGPFRGDAAIAGRQTRSLLCLPLIRLTNLVGVLYLENNLAAGAFTPAQMEFLGLLSAQAAISIENARFYDTLEQRVTERTLELQQEVERRRQAEEWAQQLAITDPLTQLYNRRYFFAVLEGELGRARRYQTGFGLLMLDIDHFKQVNDRFGHLVGDQVLKTITEMARASLRQVDTLARYGGEEFVALLPETSLESAIQAAERLRLELQARPILTTAGPVSVSASVGVTAFNEALDYIPDSLLERADQALYRAKAEGRNRVAWG